MTGDNGQTVVDARGDEIARYVEEVRAELHDLPNMERDELLEDLAAHLSEVAEDDPTPLRDRLGEPAAYATELRAALDVVTTGRRKRRSAGWRDRWQRIGGHWEKLDQRVGAIFGYQRISDFGRLLVPAWWVLRGYLAAMAVVALLDGTPTGPELGLLPRPDDGTTPAAWVILAAFVAGSVWLARRGPRLGKWLRLAVLAVSVYLLFIGAVTLHNLDQRRFDTIPDDGWSYDPYAEVQDVYPVAEDGRLLTGITLLDQRGSPIDVSYSECDLEEQPAHLAQPTYLTYPCRPEHAPWFLDPATPTPSAGR